MSPRTVNPESSGSRFATLFRARNTARHFALQAFPPPRRHFTQRQPPHRFHRISKKRMRQQEAPHLKAASTGLDQYEARPAAGNIVGQNVDDSGSSTVSMNELRQLGNVTVHIRLLPNRNLHPSQPLLAHAKFARS